MEEWSNRSLQENIKSKTKIASALVELELQSKNNHKNILLENIF